MPYKSLSVNIVISDPIFPVFGTAIAHRGRTKARKTRTSRIMLQANFSKTKIYHKHRNQILKVVVAKEGFILLMCNYKSTYLLPTSLDPEFRNPMPREAFSLN